jgi:hypothetical protein
MRIKIGAVLFKKKKKKKKMRFTRKMLSLDMFALAEAHQGERPERSNGKRRHTHIKESVRRGVMVKGGTPNPTEHTFSRATCTEKAGKGIVFLLGIFLSN